LQERTQCVILDRGAAHPAARKRCCLPSLHIDAFFMGVC